MKRLKNIAWYDVLITILLLGILVALIMMFSLYKEELRLEKELELLRQQL